MFFLFDRISLYCFFLAFIIKSPRQLHQRIHVIKRFRKIHRSVTCAHSEAELLRIADEVLRNKIAGDIIEAGVYKGGSTCKLSIVAKLTGRQLYACDSFEGLPEPGTIDKVHSLSSGKEEIYHKSDYLGTMDEVKKNLKNYGEPSAVELIPGWFNKTLLGMKNKKFALVFIDVDLHDSFVACLENLWPPLQNGCKFFTHEAHHLLTIKSFSDKTFWQEKFGINPPEFVGAGKGLSRLEPCLGYIKKCAPANKSLQKIGSKNRKKHAQLPRLGICMHTCYVYIRKVGISRATGFLVQSQKGIPNLWAFVRQSENK